MRLLFAYSEGVCGPRAEWRTRPRRSSWIPWGAIAGAALLCGCASDGSVEPTCVAMGPASRPALECESVAACSEHVDEIRRRIYRSWRPTRPAPLRGAVRIRFRLDDTGALQCAELIETTDEAARGLGTSCLAAFWATDFPELPPGGSSLANVDLETVFRYERAY